MEATGYSRWFERLLAELGIEIWMADPAEIKAKRVKKRKTDRNDALIVLRLMRENNFSASLGTESRESGSAATAVRIDWCRCAFGACISFRRWR